MPATPTEKEGALLAVVKGLALSLLIVPGGLVLAPMLAWGFHFIAPYYMALFP